MADEQMPTGASNGFSPREEINAIFDTYHSTTLWEMAKAAGLEVFDAQGRRLRRAELLPRMRAGFFTRERVMDSVQRLDARARSVLDRLLLRGGTATTKSLKRETVRAGLADGVDQPPLSDPLGYQSRVPYAQGYCGHPGRERSRVFEDVIARLTFRGIVFSRDLPKSSGTTACKAQYHPGATVYVPGVVRQFLAEPAAIMPESPDWQPQQVQRADPGLLVRDLYLYWDHVRRNEVVLLKSGLVGKRRLKVINETLIVPDSMLRDAQREDQVPRLHLLRLLLEQLDLLVRHRGRLRTQEDDPKRIPEFWGWPLEKQLPACLAAWTRLGVAESWARSAAQHGPHYRHAKDSLCNVLRDLPVGVWYEPEDLLERVQNADGGFLFGKRNQVENHQAGWHYGHTGSPYYPSTRGLAGEINQYETRFLASCVTGFLHHLAVVDLGWERTAWQAFRLTPGGRAVLSAEGGQPPGQRPGEDRGKIVVQPNFQLVAMGPVSPDSLARLDAVAERERADRGAFEYRITRESIYRAYQMGFEASEVIRFLEAESGTSLPQNIRRSLQEWEGQHERIVFRSGVGLLQAADPRLLEKLLGDTHVRGHLERAVSPDVALLKPGHERETISQLVSLGVFPAVSSGEPEGATGAVVVEPDGRLRLTQTAPSLYLLGRLSRIAEPAAEGAWRLTPESVGKAAGSREAVAHLISELQGLSGESPPQELVERIKAWGGYYGQAAAESVTLIEFSNWDTMSELLEHPDLRPHLRVFHAGDRALAVVERDRLADVKHTLTRLGMQVKDGLSH